MPRNKAVIGIVESGLVHRKYDGGGGGNHIKCMNILGRAIGPHRERELLVLERQITALRRRTREALMSGIVIVHPSIRMYLFIPHWTDYLEVCHTAIL